MARGSQSARSYSRNTMGSKRLSACGRQNNFVPQTLDIVPLLSSPRTNVFIIENGWKSLLQTSSQICLERREDESGHNYCTAWSQHQHFGTASHHGDNDPTKVLGSKTISLDLCPHLLKLPMSKRQHIEKNVTIAKVSDIEGMTGSSRQAWYF